MGHRFARVKIAPKPANWLRFKKDRIPFCTYCFTEAELKTIYALLQAPAVKDMMNVLNWSDKTVKFYRIKVCKKFGVANVDELLVFWLRLDLARTVHAVHGEHRTTRPNRNCLQIPKAEQRAQRNEYNRQYYLDHHEKMKEKTRKWREANPELAKEHIRRFTEKRRAKRNEQRKNEIPVPHLDRIVDSALRTAGSFEQCGQAASEVPAQDHGPQSLHP